MMNNPPTGYTFDGWNPPTSSMNVGALDFSELDRLCHEFWSPTGINSSDATPDISTLSTNEFWGQIPNDIPPSVSTEFGTPTMPVRTTLNTGMACPFTTPRSVVYASASTGQRWVDEPPLPFGPYPCGYGNSGSFWDAQQDPIGTCQSGRDATPSYLKATTDWQAHREARRGDAAPYHTKPRLKGFGEHALSFRLFSGEAETQHIEVFETTGQRINSHINLSSGNTPYEREEDGQLNPLSGDSRRGDNELRDGKASREVPHRAAGMNIVHYYDSVSSKVWVINTPELSAEIGDTPMTSHAQRVVHGETHKKATKRRISVEPKKLVLRHYQPKK